MASSSCSTSALSLCSSFRAHCKLSDGHYLPPLSLATRPIFSSSSSSSLKLTSRRPLLSSLKSSESDAAESSESSAAVIEADFEPSAIVEASDAAVDVPAPKREEVFAIVMIGGRQYIVFPGRFLYTQRLKGANVNDKVILNKVLLVGTRTNTYIGRPVVQNAAVHATVEEQGLDDKVIVFKYKKKKKYRRNIGHRQPNTRIRITGITGYEDSPFVTLDSVNKP